MDKHYGIESIHSALKSKMIDYITTNYLGKNDALRLATESELKETGVLFQEPYIEANAIYKVNINGLTTLNVPSDRDIIKKSLIQLSEKYIGVFKSPYLHQTKAIEAFSSGNDVFIATGTGSGKTECFMWPMISKLVEEANVSRDTWEKRGIRVMMLYPMNALVSDQIGRLRKIVDNEEFKTVLRNGNSKTRLPQFGMYTGRTEYAGQKDINKDKELAKKLSDDLINLYDPETDCSKYESKSKSISQLKHLGKFPSKKDLNKYIDELKKGNHYTDPEDTELITREEMRNNCPDIMITNYSMLQYMLIRPIEQTIWDETKMWLNSDESNKILFVVDEAHMYKGSSGGEVALLIRRFFHKLGISRDKVQFILTSASVPKDSLDSVKKFACDLTGASNDNFVLLTGDKEEIDKLDCFEINPIKMLDNINTDDLKGDFKSKLACIKQIAKNLDWKYSEDDLSTVERLSHWLYTKLSKNSNMIKIIEASNGKATSFEKLSIIAFGSKNLSVSKDATSVLLLLAHLAKKPDGNVYLPTRVHLMFRGISGLSACINSDCQYGDANSKSLGLGKIYIGKQKEKCKCGSKVFELVNDRNCGELFLKGYLDIANKDFVWNKLISSKHDNFKEVHFFIPQQNRPINSPKDNVIVWVDINTGKIIDDESEAIKRKCIRLIYSKHESKDKREKLTFTQCPKCGKSRLNLSDFSTKGNEPFFNLISEQFYSQPPTIFDDAEIEKTPNAGRKVLLFSDSRQRAATLAKDMTRAADEDAMKKALTIAAIDLQDWSLRNNIPPTLNLLYVAFLKISAENKLRFFYGDDEKFLMEDIKKMKDLIARYKRRKKDLPYSVLKGDVFAKVPDLYNEQLLKQLCSKYRSLSDSALCWVVPNTNSTIFENAIEVFYESKIKISEDEFIKIFSSWAYDIMIDYYAVGNEISDDVRLSLPKTSKYGVQLEEKFSNHISNILKEQKFTKFEIDKIYDELKNFLVKGLSGENRYLNTSLLSLKFNAKQSWFKCPLCSGVFPHTLWGKCAKCGVGYPSLMIEKDFDRLNFYRKPVIAAIEKDKSLMTRINVEEHTAQLSHKDSKQKTWSTTETYEMRFQNVYADSNKPVDILSCTTTMEVGIDIGSLTSVGLRNIPPKRENYQQRAGRAGRRGSSVSTIVTFADSGPYDSYYFNNPEFIISGEASKPWIDVNNSKLVGRHINTIIMTKNCPNLDTLSIKDFFNNKYDDIRYKLRETKFEDKDVETLVPQKVLLKQDHIERLIFNLDSLKTKYFEFPENYKEDNDKYKTTLDVLLEESILPTYAFPRNVVGFYIEDNNGKVVERPDRSIDMALNEYAPGKVVVVNKKSYKSGGVYNFHSKFVPEYYDKPAKRYLENNDYYKLMYTCLNDNCTWQSFDKPSTHSCPFCNEDIEEKYVVKPWGFAPINGKSISESKAESEFSYSTEPTLSIVLNQDEMIKPDEFKNLKYVDLPDQSLTISNKGKKEQGLYTGFTMCKLCGAIVPGDDFDGLKKIQKPYTSQRSKFRCMHPDTEIENVYLGNTSSTDMIVFQINLNNDLFDTMSDNIWLNSAVNSLAEAISSAACNILDIEFGDLSCGSRVRFDEEYTFVDIFLYDNLSSGAGYSSAIADRLKELLSETKKILENCNVDCDTACNECLKHYRNRNKHNILNRKLGLVLLNWVLENDTPSEIPVHMQYKMIEPISKLLENSNISIVDQKIFLNETKEVYVYPSSWSVNKADIPKNAILLKDDLVRYSIPEVYKIIKNYI